MCTTCMPLYKNSSFMYLIKWIENITLFIPKGIRKRKGFTTLNKQGDWKRKAMFLKIFALQIAI